MIRIQRHMKQMNAKINALMIKRNPNINKKLEQTIKEQRKINTKLTNIMVNPTITKNMVKHLELTIEEQRNKINEFENEKDKLIYNGILVGMTIDVLLYLLFMR